MRVVVSSCRPSRPSPPLLPCTPSSISPATDGKLNITDPWTLIAPAVDSTAGYRIINEYNPIVYLGERSRTLLRVNEMLPSPVSAVTDRFMKSSSSSRSLSKRTPKIVHLFLMFRRAGRAVRAWKASFFFASLDVTTLRILIRHKVDPHSEVGLFFQIRAPGRRLSARQRCRVSTLALLRLTLAPRYLHTICWLCVRKRIGEKSETGQENFLLVGP